jgi:hypothetical protein
VERFTLDFSLPNFITIGLIAALWYVLLVGGFSVAIGGGKKAEKAAA